MSLEQIIGPVMIGPSSSHTAGAARLGNLARICLGCPVTKAGIYLRGSFYKTRRGHGTDKAVLAGLMGLATDNPGIRDAFRLAGEKGMEYDFYSEDLDGAHPNSARFNITGKTGVTMNIVGASIGGGVVEIQEIDGFPVSISGELPTLVTFHKDISGVVADITRVLADAAVNIATLKLSRKTPSGSASMVIEVDHAPTPDEMLLLERCNSALQRVFILDTGRGAI